MAKQTELVRAMDLANRKLFPRKSPPGITWENVEREIADTRQILSELNSVIADSEREAKARSGIWAEHVLTPLRERRELLAARIEDLELSDAYTDVLVAQRQREKQDRLDLLQAKHQARLDREEVARQREIDETASIDFTLATTLAHDADRVNLSREHRGAVAARQEKRELLNSPAGKEILASMVADSGVSVEQVLASLNAPIETRVTDEQTKRSYVFVTEFEEDGSLFSYADTDRVAESVMASASAKLSGNASD